MKAPDKISGADFTELKNILKEHPYFHTGRFVIARAGRKLKAKSASKDLSTAATYATNRNLFKAYIQGQIKFTGVEKNTTLSTPITKPSAQVISPVELPNLEEETNPLIKEIYENLNKWNESRAQYLDYDKAHPEDIVIESAEEEPAMAEQETPEAISEPTEIEIDQVTQLKNQVAEEILAEEQSISKALSDLSDKTEEANDPKEKQIAESKETPREEETIKEAYAPEQDIEIAKEEPIQFADPVSTPKPEQNEPSKVSAKPEAPDTTIQEEEVVNQTNAIIEDDSSTESTSSFDISADELSAIVDAEAASLGTDEKQKDEQEEKSITELSQEITENAFDAVENQENTPIVEASTSTEEDIPTEASEGNEKATKFNVVEDIELNIQAPERSKEESEDALNQLDQEKSVLKLTPLSSSTQGKKFRLSTLKHGIPFTKPRAKKQNIKEEDKKSNTVKKASTKKAKPTEARAKKKPAVKKKADPEKVTSTKKKSELKTKGDNVEKKKINQFDLIDKFIEASPTIKVDKDAPSNVVDFSASSESFPDHLISENLANILINQGKSTLAITIYKKLCKKHPLNQNMYKLKIKELKNSLSDQAPF